VLKEMFVPDKERANVMLSEKRHPAIANHGSHRFDHRATVRP